MLFRKASFVALLAVVVMAFTVPTDAQAQDTTQGPPPPPPMGQQTQDVTFESLMAALSNISAETDEFEALSGLTAADVQVVSVASLQGADMNALSGAVVQNQAGIDALIAALEGNAAATQALRANNAVASDVVAVDVLSSGAVVLYTLPPQQE